jgi:tetratricopeptide (TPR) repeat protein
VNQYGRAIDSYQKMLALHPRHPSIDYNIACLYAKQRQTEEALDWLQRALEKGYRDWEQIRSDRDLAEIRSTKRYAQLEADYYHQPVEN